MVDLTARGVLDLQDLAIDIRQEGEMVTMRFELSNVADADKVFAILEGQTLRGCIHIHFDEVQRVKQH